MAVTAAIFILLSSIIFSTEARDDFTIDLIHRDSPKSPFYNPSLTHFERVKNVFQRSSTRANYSASTGAIPNGGEYLMEISYGTPPYKTLAIINTGSDLPWTQCLPCDSCFKEKFSPFNPEKSSTFKLLPCASLTCKTFPGTICKSRTCHYAEFFGSRSYSFGSTRVSFPNFSFGCGHDNFGTFPDQASGIVGLGFGESSLVTQLSSSIHGKFSYCLVPFTEISKPGKLSFGYNSAVSGPGVVSTPVIFDIFYCSTLEGMSVGNKRLNYHSAQPPHKNQSGNIIIDSGTTATYLPSKLYHELQSNVKSEIKSGKIVPDPLGIFSLCYSSLQGVKVPSVRAHFRSADVALKPLNLFVKTSDSSLCLAFIPTDNLPIFGNIAQNNFWVGYDLEKKIVSFKPTDCTKP